MDQHTGTPKLTAEEVNARMGWTITEEGKARARRRLAEADARRDLPARAAFLAELRSHTA
jgi:hypothetical protein